MTEALKIQRGPGRPSTGAKERILDAGLETLLEEGYAGLTYTKVAEKAGENKSLISYYFDSRQGLVGAVAELVGERITGEILEEIRETKQVIELAAGLVSGLWKVMDDDQRIARLYFDLSAVSVVDDQVGVALREVKHRWRQVIARYLTEAGVGGSEIEAASVYLLAGVEGLAIERLDEGESARLESARAMFVRGAAFAISGEAA
ncbi:MAG: TetR/AcrR family transcriptional regulator [Solirubrobacterales bacterium]|nr:TetR/AcrR family transcriptional regulator [Solirubrobacterales bacterium]